MDVSEISLLVFLEAQLVTNQGFFHSDDLTPSDWKTIEEWKQNDLVFLEKLNKIPRLTRQQFTHKIRLSKILIDRAWEARLEKIEQFCPVLKHDLDDPLPDEKPLEGKNEKGEYNHGDELYAKYILFLESHSNHPTPIQKQAARGIFNVLGQMPTFMSARSPGRSWLLKSIDQFITSITRPKNNNGQAK